MIKIINFIKSLFEYRDRMDEGAVAPSPMTENDRTCGIWRI